MIGLTASPGVPISTMAVRSAVPVYLVGFVTKLRGGPKTLVFEATSALQAAGLFAASTEHLCASFRVVRHLVDCTGNAS